MDRRRFLQALGATTALLAEATAESPNGRELQAAQMPVRGAQAFSSVDVEGHTKLCTFTRDRETWTVYEDLRARDGALSFVTGEGRGYVLQKSAEAAFADPGQQHLGLDLKQIGLSGPDLLADKLLAAGGDPEEAAVRAAAPPMNSAPPPNDPNYRPPWDTLVGTRECLDTMPVFPAGNTRTYHPTQYFHAIAGGAVARRHDGLVGGWRPAVRKVFPGETDGHDDASDHYEVLVFADVLATDRFIVQTWHRTCHVVAGRIAEVHYGYSYPSYARRKPPAPEEFYRGLLAFVEYWDSQMHDIVPLTLPEPSWVDMTRYAFVKEQIVRPGGTYPKYGAVERDYYGPEYDGFQDIFTMSLTANLELGRFAQACDVLDGYFTDFVDQQGMINMRGAETAQFGLTLWLIARYYSYTRDAAVVRKHREKIRQTALMLAELQDESLKLSPSHRAYGMICGWNESDACLNRDPEVWNKPYYANAAMTVRGWREIASLWRELKFDNAQAADWERRAEQLHAGLLRSIEKNTRHEMQPAYLGPLPGVTKTFRESMQTERPSEQGWPHRAYAELVHADVLPPETANMVINCMRAYGATSIGVVANVGLPDPEDRGILGFISYGYAQQLLRLDRVEEYLLFLYAHRYHDHSRGSWTAGEVSSIAGGGALFCIPAQQTIPILIKWMLVSEEPDRAVLHLGRAIPRAWVGSGKPIAIEQAPTRWGRVDYSLLASGHEARASVRLAQGAAPDEVHVRFRLPAGTAGKSVSVNGQDAQMTGAQVDTVVIKPGNERAFSIIAVTG